MTNLCCTQEEKERKEQEEQRKKYDEDAKKKKALSNMTQQYSAGQKVIQLTAFPFEINKQITSGKCRMLENPTRKQTTEVWMQAA